MGWLITIILLIIIQLVVEKIIQTKMRQHIENAKKLDNQIESFLSEFKMPSLTESLTEEALIECLNDKQTVIERLRFEINLHLNQGEYLKYQLIKFRKVTVTLILFCLLLFVLSVVFELF